MMPGMRIALPGVALLGLAVPVAPAPAPRAFTAVSLDGLGDGIRHYRNRHGADYPTYPAQQIVEIADNILLMQRTSGGWIENQDPTRVLDAGERARLLAEKDKPDISFDNRNITAQVAYLAAVLEQTGDPRYRQAARRGLEVILAQQEPTCGGWPHTVPAREPYHSHITIADEVTPLLLAQLRQVAASTPPFGFTSTDPALRERAARAVARGDACLLRLQILQRGARSGWAGQYDRQTLRPALGRSYELPSLVAWESTGVLRYLMSIPDPPPEVVLAVEGGVGWLRRSQLTGLRVETFPAEPVRYQFHTSTTDRRLVEDPKAPPLWARFYDLEDNSVVLANRDGKRVTRYGDIARERRTGYAWYGDWPARLLAEDYPAWRARVAARAPAPVKAPGTPAPPRH